MSQKIKTLLFAGITVFVVFSLIKFPDDALEASIRGLNMWWEVVFPSLLPFFIMAELLLAFGVVKFLGVLFEPIMRPLFKIPGAGSFGLIMGMASGYPTGAKIAARLREDKQLSRIQAERLVSFTNNSSPLFIFGAVSIGFFGDAKLGILLAVCHYAGNIIVGICMRFYGRKEEKSSSTGGLLSKKDKISIVRAFKEMHRARMNDSRPLGEIVGDAVINSIKTLVMVGGFIILFSVLIKLIFITGVSPIISIFFEQLLKLFSLPVELALPFFSGLFEITIGAKLISDLKIDTLLAEAIIVSFILGFNGFSIQAQVASILSKTDIRFSPYFFSRILHGFVGSFLTILLYRPLYLNKQAFELDDVPVSNEVTQNSWTVILNTFEQIGPVITIVFLGIAAMILYKRNFTKIR